VTHSGPEVLFQDLRRDEIRGWWWWWWCRGHVADLIDLPQRVEIDLAGLRHVRDFFVESRFWAR